MSVPERSEQTGTVTVCREEEKLDELDTDGVEPLSHIFGDQNVFREDVVTNGDNKEAMLANAPKAKEGQYQVPKTIG